MARISGIVTQVFPVFGTILSPSPPAFISGQVFTTYPYTPPSGNTITVNGQRVPVIGYR